MTNYQFKTIGFLKEQDENLILPEFMDNNVNFDSFPLSEIVREKVINYLNEGTMVFSTLLALFDGDKHIAPRMLFSDGEWIWTSHFAYYLKKLNFSLLTNEFLNHLRANDFKVPPLSKEQRTYIDIFIHLKLLKISEKDKEIIRQNAVKLGYDLSNSIR